MLTTSSAGGISDIFMRVLGEELHKSLGQPIIIENRPGGSGNIGARACQDAQPDGYTICIINADPMIYNQYLFKSLTFDPDKLTPIVNLFHLIQVLVINSDLGAKSVDELVAVSKAKPGTLSYLTASIPCVVYMDSLKQDKGADWVRVPFKGGGEATNAILGGSTPIGLIGLGNVIAQIRANKMNALALVNNIRTPLLPDVPTWSEAAVDKIAAEVTRVFADKEFVEKYVISRGQVPAINTPAQFAAEIKADREAAKDVVKASGLEPQ